MKLYIPPPSADLMRINIKQQYKQTEHIAVCECEQLELYKWIKQLIEQQQLSIFANGSLLTIEIRETLGGVNGKIMSISFKGMTPSEAKELILKNINNY